MNNQWIVPDWPAPDHVRAVSTIRNGGISPAPWDSMNPASHTGDRQDNVRKNREILQRIASLPAEPLWLQQVHGNVVVDAADAPSDTEADGSFARASNVVCAVMTADCLPVLLCNRKGSEVAALHAGWRGLASGILDAGVNSFNASSDDIIAWLGPCIGPNAFEVGSEVRDAFLDTNSSMSSAFLPAGRSGHWLADLQRLASITLNSMGIAAIYAHKECTFENKDLFFSYRRDGECGRMATLIWIANTEN